MTRPGLPADFSAARRQDGQLRRTVVVNHVRLCADCQIYAPAVTNPEFLLANLARIELPGGLRKWNSFE